MRQGGAGFRARGRTLSWRAVFGSVDLEARSMTELARRGVVISEVVVLGLG